MLAREPGVRITSITSSVVQGKTAEQSQLAVAEIILLTCIASCVLTVTDCLVRTAINT